MDRVTTDELAARLGEVTILDVRSEGEYSGIAGYPCCPRQGHVPGARHVELGGLAEARTADEIRALVGEPEGAEIVVYCHSGSRSQLAASVLAAAGYRTRNYVASWHEWSQRQDLPVES